MLSGEIALKITIIIIIITVCVPVLAFTVTVGVLYGPLHPLHHDCSQNRHMYMVILALLASRRPARSQSTSSSHLASVSFTDVTGYKTVVSGCFAFH